MLGPHPMLRDSNPNKGGMHRRLLLVATSAFEPFFCFYEGICGSFSFVYFRVFAHENNGSVLLNVFGLDPTCLSFSGSVRATL